MAAWADVISAVWNGADKLNVAITGGGSGGTSNQDDAAFTPGADYGTVAMGIYRATRDAIDSGDAGAVALSANRAQYVVVETPNGDSAMDETNDALRVNVVAGSTSGTQYTEGDTDSSITGTAILWEDASETLRSVSMGTALPVKPGTSATFPVSAASLPLPTGAATAAKQPALGTAGSASADVISVQGVASMTPLLVNASGNAVPVTDNSGSLTVDGTVALGAGDAAVGRVKITDGTDVADVLDLANANPITVAIVDGSGDQITSFGGGTQYTEDAAAAANPVGNMLIGRRKDSLSTTEVSADGDNIALNATSKGELHVKHADAIPVTDNGGSLTVDGTVAVSSVGGTVTVDGSGVTQPVSHAALTELAAAIDTELQVDVVGALPAGTNNIGDVDVLSVVPGTGATALGKAEDAAHTTGDTGVMALAVRRDANTTLVGTDGDYAPLQVNADGSLKVAITAGAGSGGTSATDDSAFTVASGSGTPVMGLADETSPDSVDEGDVGVVRMTLTRALHVNLRDASGAEVSVGGGTQYDEDTAHVSGDKLTMAGVVRADTAAAQAGTDGDRTVLITDASGRLHVNVGNTVTVGSHAVTNAGTFAVQESGAALTALQLIDNLVLAEDAVHTTADPGVQALAVRKATPANLSGADGDYEPLQVNGGRLWVDASGVTLTVGSHAVTNAGTFAVQESGAALTALQLIDNLVLAEDAVHTTADPGIQALAVRKATPANLSGADGDYEPLQVNAGRLWVDASGVTLTVASHAVTNAGTFVVQENGAALTALQKIDDPVLVDDAAFTPGTSSVMMAGAQADETSPDSVNEGDAGAVRMSLERFLVVTPRPTATGEGYSVHRTIDLDESEEEVKASAGKLYGYFFTNLSASTKYIKFYDNTAAGTTVGTTTPFLTIPLEADQAAHIEWSLGIPMSTGICVAATTGVADNDTGAPGANEVVGFVLYK